MPPTSPQPTAWITGAGGLIGNYLVRLAPVHAPGWRVRGLTRQEVDLLDFSAVRRLFVQDHPDLLIHCAALSSSAICQNQTTLARRVNVEATTRLAELAQDIPLVFFSTDLVFDGQKGGYTESDPPNPLNVYGETKALAESVVRRHPRHIVLRISLNGGISPSGTRGFNEELRQAWKAGQTLRLFTDEFRSPMAAVVTAEIVWSLIHRGISGLYHLAGSERLSRWEIGQLLAARWPELNPRIEPASLTTYVGTPRPPDTSLNCHHLLTVLQRTWPSLSQWLQAHPQEMF